MEGFDGYSKGQFVVISKDDFKTAALEKYTDECTENLMRVINAKMKRKKPKLVGDDHTPKQAEVVDLMARLRASLEGKTGSGSSKKPAASKGRKATRGPRRVA